MTITLAELMDALAKETAAPEDARTAAQMATELGVSQVQVQKALRALHAHGRVQCYRVPCVGIDGRRTTVPAYTIRPAP